MHVLSEHEGCEEKHDAADGALADLPFAKAIGPQAHGQGDRNAGADGERSPGAFCERVDHDDAQTRDGNDHDGENGHHGDHAGHRTEFVPYDLRERAAVATNRRRENDEVMHGTGEHDADEKPQEAGREPELRCERGADQGSGARDRSEVVTEEHPAVGGHVVVSVREAMGGRDGRGVEREHPGGDERGVVTIRDRDDAERAEHHGGRLNVHDGECVEPRGRESTGERCAGFLACPGADGDACAAQVTPGSSRFVGDRRTGLSTARTDGESTC